MGSDYLPEPINIDAIELDQHLLELIERLARHNHDLWALQRLSDGWRWGPTRCDEARTHPCLVAYEHLPESEKQYDRLSAIGTIKAVIASGYRITMTLADTRGDGTSS